MSKTPNHMAGINSLPKWDPNNLSRGYTYDPKNYDRADYTRFKEARAARDKAAYAQSQKNLKAARQQFPKNFRKAILDKTKEAHAAQFKGPSETQIRNAAKSGRTLHITTPSSCFDSVNWKNGNVSVVFWNGYSYQAPLDLDTMLEWASDASLGSFFNHVLGQEFFAD
jgi:hypothetical protein